MYTLIGICTNADICVYIYIYIYTSCTIVLTSCTQCMIATHAWHSVIKH